MRGRPTSYLLNLLSTRGLKTAGAKAKVKPAKVARIIDDEDDAELRSGDLKLENDFLEGRNDELLQRIYALQEKNYAMQEEVNRSAFKLAEAHVMLRKVQEECAEQLPESLTARIKDHLSAFEMQKQTDDEVRSSRKIT